MSYIEKSDKIIFDLIKKEEERQNYNLELIASENFVSKAVLEAQGSVLTNKYAEGYPGKRYYGGCEFHDEIENIAIERAKKMFDTDYHANVQPHSGSQANTAVYFSQLNVGDTILSMDLAHGGHLSHGMKINISGKYFNIIPYGVSEKTETIDYEEVRKLAKEHKPKLILAGASAYPRIIDFAKFKEIADEVGALFMTDIAHIAGLVVAKLHPTPFGLADFVTTTTHKTLRGPRSGLVMCKEEYAKQINSAVFPGLQGGPLMHVISAKAVAFGEALTDDFKKYQEQVLKNAKVLSEELQKAGYRIVSGGTDNHLMLVDVSVKGISGKKAEKALDKAGITVNKNMIPFDQKKPTVTSGIRLGTPAMTTKGMKEDEMRKIASFIDRVIMNYKDEDILSKVKSEVREMMKNFQ